MGNVAALYGASAPEAAALDTPAPETTKPDSPDVASLETVPTPPKSAPTSPEAPDAPPTSPEAPEAKVAVAPEAKVAVAPGGAPEPKKGPSLKSLVRITTSGSPVWRISFEFTYPGTGFKRYYTVYNPFEITRAQWDALLDAGAPIDVRLTAGGDEGSIYKSEGCFVFCERPLGRDVAARVECFIPEPDLQSKLRGILEQACTLGLPFGAPPL